MLLFDESAVILHSFDEKKTFIIVNKKNYKMKSLDSNLAINIWPCCFSL